MHTDAKRYYAVLGLHPAASEKSLRVAFRRRAKELHPDSPTGDANAFILLKLAYDTLIDPARRTAYDLSCQPPRPPPVEIRQPHLYSTPSPPPAMPGATSRRRGGMGIMRYVIAFLVMAAISLGGVQAMISLTGGPPSIQTRGTASRSEPEIVAVPTTEIPAAPGSSKSGFWDATPAASGKKTP